MSKLLNIMVIMLLFHY